VELCCSPALMAGLFGYSNQNICRFYRCCHSHRFQHRWRACHLLSALPIPMSFGGLPFIMNGDDLMSSVDLHVDGALNGSKALRGLVTQCHSSVLMTGIKVQLWDLGIVSLFGIMARIWAVMALQTFMSLHSCKFGVGCWFFLRHPNFPC